MTAFEAALPDFLPLTIDFTVSPKFSDLKATTLHSLGEKNIRCFPLGKIPNVTGCGDTLDRRRDQQDFRRHEEDAISLERV